MEAPKEGGPANLPAPASPQTFRDLVAALSAFDDGAAFGTIDPAILVGDIKDKVDAIKNVLDRLDGAAGWLREQADPFIEKARALEANRKRLWDYVSTSMRDGKLHAAPGHAWKVTLRDSNPALVIDREPTAIDFERWQSIGLVKMVRYYEWDKAKLKEHLASGADTSEIPAKLTRGVWPEFSPRIPESLEPKKRGKKK